MARQGRQEDEESEEPEEPEEQFQYVRNNPGCGTNPNISAAALSYCKNVDEK